MANAPAFQIGEALSAGWQLTKQYWKYLLAYLGAIIAVAIGMNIVGGLFRHSGFLSFIWLIITQVVVLGIALIFVRLGLKLVDGQKPEQADFFWFDTKVVINGIITMILFELIYFGGLLLLIIPGIIFAFMFGQALYAVVDKGLKPVEALKYSHKITQGNKLQLFLFALVSGVLVFFGALLFLVGLIIVVPVIAMAQFYIYRKLTQAAS